MSNVEESDGEDASEEHVRPPAYYRAHAERLNETDIVPAYADKTKLQIDSLEEQWRR